MDEGDALAGKCDQLIADQLSEREEKIIQKVMKVIDDGDLIPGEWAIQQFMKIHAGRELRKKLQRKERRAIGRPMSQGVEHEI